MLPKEILINSVDSLYAANRIHSNLIYIALLLMVAVSMALLPIIEVDVTVQSPAVIRPSTEKAMIRSLVSGIVKKSFVKENGFVKEFDTLYVIENKVLLEREQRLFHRAFELSCFLEDIKALIIYIRTPESMPILKTQYFKQTLAQFLLKKTDAGMRLRKAKVESDRSHKLHDEQVIADAEFEENNYSLAKAQEDVHSTTTTQLVQLRNEELAYLKEFDDVQFQRAEILKEKENLTIKAPCSGTAIINNPTYKGSAISAGMSLIEISPDTSLVTEVYVSPHDVGLLKQNMSVMFQIDAFNYNEWGFASGNVLEISDDTIIVGDLPVFKVKCTLNTNYLQLANGYKAVVKKGMTVSARFVVAQRSLWQLLFDNIDNWLNPHLNKATV